LRLGFASEEYDGPAHDDVLGVFVGGQSVAVLPGTSTRIGVSSVGPGSPYYQANGVSSAGYTSLAYNGYTDPFTIRLTLTPGQQTSLKVAIADAGEFTHDSAVFIAGLSSPLQAQAGHSGTDGFNDPGSFGPAQHFTVPAGGSYVGVGTVVTSGVPGANPLNGGAVILAGDNRSGRSAAVQMRWRDRATVEGSFGNNGQNPPLPQWALWMYSDAVEIGGLNRGDPYVLQMDYAESEVPLGTEEIDATAGHIYLGKLQPLDPGALWSRAVDRNIIAPGIAAFLNYQGSWEDFVSPGNPGFHRTLEELRGSFGVDTASNTVWAVLDYSDAQFGVVPEPSTLAMCTMLGAFLAVYGWRRYRRAC